MTEAKTRREYADGLRKELYNAADICPPEIQDTLFSAADLIGSLVNTIEQSARQAEGLAVKLSSF